MTAATAIRALRDPRAWLQLMRFATVGASGYVVNLAVFAAFVGSGTGHRGAAVAAFLVAVTNNFAWNRRWTFVGSRGLHVGSQAARFLMVSIGAFGVSLAILELLIYAWGVPELAAQAAAIVAATPLSFLGNRLWSFRH